MTHCEAAQFACDDAIFKMAESRIGAWLDERILAHHSVYTPEYTPERNWSEYTRFCAFGAASLAMAEYTTSNEGFQNWSAASGNPGSSGQAAAGDLPGVSLSAPGSFVSARSAESGPPSPV